MEDLLAKSLMALASTAILLLVFWRIGLLLPKPENKTENLRNFHLAHPAVLFNKEFKCEVFYPVIAILISQPITVYLGFSLIAMSAGGLPFQIFSAQIGSLPIVLQVLLGLLIIDISLWIRHGFVHKFLWSFHAVHHSAKELTFLTTRRLHPLDQIVMGLIDFAILYVIGFSAEGMVIALIIKDLNNLFVHSNIVLDYPKPLKYILVSPNMHRWHHATELEARDKNFCVVFAFVDYVMGTYYVPDNALPKVYGCDNPELDDIERKNILTELWLPFTVQRQRPPAPAAAPATVATKADASQAA
jgi:sterol desaturase/sphingolipid hydroxylase (fatty acid hydroxylase superfamily)